MLNIFGGCYGLASVTIPNSVTSIGDEAFTWCGMTSLYIPKSVTSIGEGAFVRCPMTSIIVDTANPKYDSRDNCNALIETASNTLLKGGINTIIPNSVTSIGDWAFGGCTRLTSINIPNSVTTIGEAAFTECGLTSVTIPNSVTSIGNGAFSITNLTSVTIPNSVTNLGDNVFWDCPLVSVTVENPIPFAIGSDTFSEIPDNVILYVPFGSKTAYQTADYWKDFKNIVEYGEIPFADATVKSLCVKNWDTNGDGELSLNEAAAVTSLGTVFKNSKITSFKELQYFTGLTSIDEGAFSSSTIIEVTLPETVTSLAKEAFLYCKSLTAIHLPAKVQTIGQNALSGCSALTAITVDEANEYFCDIDGVLFNKDKTTLVQFPIAKNTDYTVPEGTKVIGRDAFFMSKLVTVTLPASLKEIGYDAFGYSTSLTEVNIPEGVTTFGPYVFDGCSALKDVYCDITAPYAIDKNNFSTKAYSNATLHVLPYLVDTYKNLEGWKYFANIKGDVIDYAVTVEATTINLGETAILPVLVANSGEIDGLQFDFTLPAGVTVATDMVGGLVVTTTDRSNKLSATCAKIADNTYRVLLLSINRAIIAVGEGAVLNIQLQCADDATGGDYDISFTNVSVSRVEGDKSVNVKVADFTAPLTVVEISKIPGDVDGNFTVDVTDVMIIVDYILNRPCNNFNFANADLDGDGTINVTDAMNVVNIILHKSNVRVSPTAQKIDRDLLRLGTSETGCQLHTAFDAPTITALQMEVMLPEGCRLNDVSLTGKAVRSHMVKTHQLYDRTYNVVVFSIKGSALDTDAPFLQLDLEGNGGLVKIENILCTDTNHESLTFPNLSAEVTDVNAITAGENSDTPAYNLSGQRLAKPRKGINIANGKKVVVK